MGTEPVKHGQPNSAVQVHVSALNQLLAEYYDRRRPLGVAFVQNGSTIVGFGMTVPARDATELYPLPDTTVDVRCAENAGRRYLLATNDIDAVRRLREVS